VVLLYINVIVDLVGLEDLFDTVVELLLPTAFRYSDRKSVDASTNLLAAIVSKGGDSIQSIVVKQLSAVVANYTRGATPEYGLASLRTLSTWVLILLKHVTPSETSAAWKSIVCD
jgi:hypothetical protein